MKMISNTKKVRIRNRDLYYRPPKTYMPKASEYFRLICPGYLYHEYLEPGYYEITYEVCPS